MGRVTTQKQGGEVQTFARLEGSVRGTTTPR